MPPHTAVDSPACGPAPEAMPRAIDSEMETIATVVAAGKHLCRTADSGIGPSVVSSVVKSAERLAASPLAGSAVRRFGLSGIAASSAIIAAVPAGLRKMTCAYTAGRTLMRQQLGNATSDI